jgi:hypothetical protein
MSWTVEYTDTFAGEANYGWVRRRKIGNEWGMRPSRRMLVGRAKKLLGLNGVPCKVEEYGETITLRPQGQCTIVFITKDDDNG